MTDSRMNLRNWRQQALIFSAYAALGALYSYAIDLVDPIVQPQSGVAILFVYISAMIATGCFALLLNKFAKVQQAPKLTIIVPVLVGSVFGVLIGLAVQGFVLVG